VTEQGLRTNVSVALQYLAAWLGGSGAVGINNLMEYAATAEISRSQLWQWIHHGTLLDNGRPVTRELVRQILTEEAAALEGRPHVEQAATLFGQVALAEDYAEFLTVPAYELVDG
jgi:malate synthase